MLLADRLGITKAALYYPGIGGCIDASPHGMIRGDLAGDDPSPEARAACAVGSVTWALEHLHDIAPVREVVLESALAALGGRP